MHLSITVKILVKAIKIIPEVRVEEIVTHLHEP